MRSPDARLASCPGRREARAGTQGRLARIYLASALIIALAGTLAHAEPPTLRYGQAYSALRSIFSLPISVADRQGFFRDEGLNFQIVVLIPGGSDKMIDALHDGTVDVTHVATPFLIRKVLAGSDAAAIAGEFNNPVYSLMAQPQIKTFADLRGKRIGFADPGGTISMSIGKLLARNGLREGDYTAQMLEGTPARYNCLKRGECDAVPLGQPQDMAARAEGFVQLGITTDVTPEFLYTVTAARRSWAEANRDTVVRYVRALRTAFRFIRDPANRDTVTGIVADTNSTSKAIAGDVLKLFFEPDRGVMPREGELNIAGLAQVIGMMGEAGAISLPLPPPEKFVDRQYLQAAGVR